MFKNGRYSLGSCRDSEQKSQLHPLLTRTFHLASWVNHLLGLLCHHQHQIEVVRSQRVFVQVVHVNEEQQVLQSLFCADAARRFLRLCWTDAAHADQLENHLLPRVSVKTWHEASSVVSPRSSWTFCRAISNSGTVFFTWAVRMDRKNLDSLVSS